MVEIRDLFMKLGLKNVTSYIQSGNVIFQSSNRNSKVLETNIQKFILNQFGFEVPVLIKTKEELSNIYNNCPFADDKKTESYFVFLAAPS